MTRKVLVILILQLPCITGCSQKIEDLHFLAGSWKVDGKETYEDWEKTDAYDLKGCSYKIRNGEKIITEYLTIKRVEGNVIYEATVLDQNDAKPVPFTLAGNNVEGFSFENPGHDFPTKIQYQKISDTEMVVRVLGADDKGFILRFTKQ